MDELVQQVGEAVIEVANNAALRTVSVVGTEVMSLTANWKMVLKEAASTRAELNKLRAADERVSEKHRSTLTKVRKASG